MTKQLLLRGGLLLGGVVLTAVTVQHAVRTDGGAAAETVAAVVGAPQRRTGAAAPSPASLAPDSALVGTVVDTPRDTAAAGELTTSAVSEDQRVEPKGTAAILSRLLALLRRDGTDPARAGDAPAPPVVLVDPGTSSTGPTASAAAAESQCKSHDLQAQAQGVSADVSFVGILLTGAEREDQKFSGAELSDLKILVQWSNLFSNHRQRVELVAPDGSVYQSLSRSLTTADSAAPVATMVPVSGTWITRYGLYGAWCVDVFFDQDEKPVASRRVSISS